MRQKESIWITLGRAVLFSALVATGPLAARADGSRVSPADAINHVGETSTVCGRGASAKYAVDSDGQPTFLNLDKAYPYQIFTGVIWERSRAAFSYAPQSLAGHQVCISG